MAAEPPLTQLVLAATSVADDLGFVALTDLSRALHGDGGDRYRIIGGHMLTALVARWGLGGDLYRETGDTDLGVPPVLVRELDLIDRLVALGYEQVAGDRFARTMTDLPVRLVGTDEPTRRAIIDVLIPAYTSRPRSNRKVGEALVATEVPGLATALQRPAITMDLRMLRLDRSMLTATLSFCDEVWV